MKLIRWSSVARRNRQHVSFKLIFRRVDSFYNFIGFREKKKTSIKTPEVQTYRRNSPQNMETWCTVYFKMPPPPITCCSILTTCSAVREVGVLTGGPHTLTLEGDCSTVSPSKTDEGFKQSQQVRWNNAQLNKVRRYRAHFFFWFFTSWLETGEVFLGFFFWKRSDQQGGLGRFQQMSFWSWEENNSLFRSRQRGSFNGESKKNPCRRIRSDTSIYLHVVMEFFSG